MSPQYIQFLKNFDYEKRGHFMISELLPNKMVIKINYESGHSLGRKLTLLNIAEN